MLFVVKSVATLLYKMLAVKLQFVAKFFLFFSLNKCGIWQATFPSAG